jgi:glycosyltransferase involved in cell wall biosynthesis
LIVAYNAEATLEQVIARIPPAMLAKVEEIFVFDDANQDRTYEVGKQLQTHYAGAVARERGSASATSALSQLSIVRNPVSLMYGGNQRRGYQYAIERGLDIVVLLHGDGQYAPEVMQELLTSLETGQADMVMGSRMMAPGAYWPSPCHCISTSAIRS